MLLNPERWEHGSEFHWLESLPAPADISPWDDGGLLYGSGRDAMLALLQHGRATRGWKRLWLPDYFCQEVAAALATVLPLEIYDDTPLQETPFFDNNAFALGDVVLWVSFFGLRAGPANLVLPKGVELIEDYTHDPWAPGAFASEADWTLASLRKTLPVPDGGALWSLRGHEMPPTSPLSDVRRVASLEKLSAMLLKSLYLQGHAVEKDAFRALALSGEEHIASGDASAMPEWTAQLLNTFPVAEWRRARACNHRALCEAVVGAPGVTILVPSRGPSSEDAEWPPRLACPFSGIAVFDTTERRDQVRRQLIAERIYPAILWSMENPAVPRVSPGALDLSRRMLSVHCDARYSESDMERVGAVITRACNNLPV